jgi:hypothetical protein
VGQVNGREALLLADAVLASIAVASAVPLTFRLFTRDTGGCADILLAAVVLYAGILSALGWGWWLLGGAFR